MAATFHFTVLLIASAVLFTRLSRSELGLLNQLGELGTHLFQVQGKAANQLYPTYSSKLCKPNSVVLLMLVLAGDIELNPGPSVYPCGYCEKPVTWENEAVCCDNCSLWHHKTCTSMCSEAFSQLDGTNVQWHCCKCDSINANSFTYHSYNSDHCYTPNQSCDITSGSLSSPNSSNNKTSTFQSPLKSSTPKRSQQNVSSVTSMTSTSDSHTSATNDSLNFTLPTKMSQNLRILHLNCRGLQQKTSEFKALIEYTKPDIVCGTESFLRGVKPGKDPEQNSIKSPEIFPPEYNVYRNDRNTDGGGVFILIHKSIVSMENPEFVTNCEIVWAKLHLKGCKELFISTFYMPHRNIQDLTSLDLSLNAVNEKGNRHLIVCGDFNCPDIEWSSHSIGTGVADKATQETLVDIAQHHSLTQMQEEPTRQQNILDLTFTNIPSLIKKTALSSPAYLTIVQ